MSKQPAAAKAAAAKKSTTVKDAAAKGKARVSSGDSSEDDTSSHSPSDSSREGDDDEDESKDGAAASDAAAGSIKALKVSSKAEAANKASMTAAAAASTSTSEIWPGPCPVLSNGKDCSATIDSKAAFQNHVKLEHSLDLAGQSEAAKDNDGSVRWFSPPRKFHGEGSAAATVRKNTRAELDENKEPVAPVLAQRLFKFMQSRRHDAALKKTAQRAAASVLRIESGGLQGSAVLVSVKDDDGVKHRALLTTRHCVKNKSANVFFFDANAEQDLFHNSVLRSCATKELQQDWSIFLSGGAADDDNFDEWDICLLEAPEALAHIRAAPLAAAPTESQRNTLPTLLHIGFGGGDKRVSISGVCWSSLAALLHEHGAEYGFNLKGKIVSWNDRETRGIIEKADIKLNDDDGDVEWVTIKVRSERTTKVFLYTPKVHSDTIHPAKNTRKSRKAHLGPAMLTMDTNGKMVTCVVELEDQIVRGADYAVVGHRTSGGSSGGGYFTLDGKLFGIHRGSSLMEPLRDHHLILFPWAASVRSPIFKEPILTLEAKPPPVVLHKWEARVKSTTFGVFEKCERDPELLSADDDTGSTVEVHVQKLLKRKHKDLPNDLKNAVKAALQPVDDLTAGLSPYGMEHFIADRELLRELKEATDPQEAAFTIARIAKPYQAPRFIVVAAVNTTPPPAMGSDIAFEQAVAEGGTFVPLHFPPGTRRKMHAPKTMHAEFITMRHLHELMDGQRDVLLHHTNHHSRLNCGKCTINNPERGQLCLHQQPHIAIIVNAEPCGACRADIAEYRDWVVQ